MLRRLGLPFELASYGEGSLAMCLFILRTAACTNLQALSGLPPNKWGETEGVGALGAGTLAQLLRLHAAFGKARRLLREMGEVRACFGAHAVPSVLCYLELFDGSIKTANVQCFG